MTAADIDAVLAIERAAVAFPWSRAQYESSLSGGDICTVLECDREIVGFSIFSLVLDEACLLNIAVDPRCQGRGLARELLRQGLQVITGRGAAVCYLEVRVSNLIAQTLYKTLGFAVVGQRKSYYPAHAGREDALVMARELPLGIR